MPLTADVGGDTICNFILHGSSLSNLGQVQPSGHKTWPQLDFTAKDSLEEAELAQMLTQMGMQTAWPAAQGTISGPAVDGQVQVVHPALAFNSPSSFLEGDGLIITGLACAALHRAEPSERRPVLPDGPH